MASVIQKYQTGFRVVTGESLNQLVNALNNIQGNGTPTAGYFTSGSFTGNVTLVPGTAAVSNTYQPAGALSVNVTAQASTATTSTQTMMSYSLPANSLNSNGRGVLVRAWGITGGSTGNKVIALNIGGKALQSSTTQSGSTWQFTALYFRTGASAQDALMNGQFHTTALAPTNGTDTSTDTGAITIAVTASQGSASATDVTQQGLIVEYYR